MLCIFALWYILTHFTLQHLIATSVVLHNGAVFQCHHHHHPHHPHHHLEQHYPASSYHFQDGNVLCEQTKLESKELIDCGGGANGGVVIGDKDSPCSINNTQQPQQSSCQCACSRPVVGCLKQDDPATDDDSPCSYERGRVVMCDLVLANARTRSESHGGMGIGSRTLQQQQRDRRERDHSLDSYATTGRKGILTWKPRRGQSEGDLSVDPNPPYPLPPPPPPPLAKRRPFNNPPAPNKSPSPYYDCDQISCPYGKELRCLCPPTPCCEVHGFPPIYSRCPSATAVESSSAKFQSHSDTLPRSQQQQHQQPSQPQGILRNASSSQNQKPSSTLPLQCSSDSFYRGDDGGCDGSGSRQRLSMPSEFYKPLPLCQCEDFYNSIPPPVVPPSASMLPSDSQEIHSHCRSPTDTYGSSAVRVVHLDNQRGPVAMVPSSYNRISNCEPYLDPPENYTAANNISKQGSCYF